MKKLDEIEKRYSSEGEIKTIQIADDLGLLVRAVRQLGAVFPHEEICNKIFAPHVPPTNCDCLEGRIDPDVLELLEE